MIALVHVNFQTVIVFCRVGAVGTLILYLFRVRFHVRAQHGQVNAGVVALRALERLRSDVIPQMILQMMLVLGDKRAFGALEQLFRFYVQRSLMVPIVFLV